MTPKLPSPPTWNLFVGVVKIQKVMITPLTLPFAPSIVGRGAKKAGRLLPWCKLDDGEAKSNKEYVNIPSPSAHGSHITKPEDHIKHDANILPCWILLSTRGFIQEPEWKIVSWGMCAPPLRWLHVCNARPSLAPSLHRRYRLPVHVSNSAAAALLAAPTPNHEDGDGDGGEDGEQLIVKEILRRF